MGRGVRYHYVFVGYFLTPRRGFSMEMAVSILISLRSIEIGSDDARFLVH